MPTPEVTRRDLRDRWLSRLATRSRDADPRAAAALGRALGMFKIGDRIADNRPSVGLREDGLPDIDWVPIPAGKFIYQNGKELTLPAFEMARYPITYVQFQTFIDDPEGFRNERWWEDLSLPEDHRNAPGNQAFKFWNHPRERVSWYDTLAFCRWLSWQFGGGYNLDKIARWAVRLPTEQEWEKAARGTDGRAYPWDNDYREGYANIDEATGNVGKYYLRQTSAVGIYPQGASPYGILDLTGNVWEWCLTDYEHPSPEAQKESLRSNSARVLCGGSWGLIQVNARAVNRFTDSPFSRASNVGFRVVHPLRAGT